MLLYLFKLQVCDAGLPNLTHDEKLGALRVGTCNEGKALGYETHDEKIKCAVPHSAIPFLREERMAFAGSWKQEIDDR